MLFLLFGSLSAAGGWGIGKTRSSVSIGADSVKKDETEKISDEVKSEVIWFDGVKIFDIEKFIENVKIDDFEKSIVLVNCDVSENSIDFENSEECVNFSEGKKFDDWLKSDEIENSEDSVNFVVSEKTCVFENLSEKVK